MKRVSPKEHSVDLNITNLPLSVQQNSVRTMSNGVTIVRPKLIKDTKRDTFCLLSKINKERVILPKNFAASPLKSEESITTLDLHLGNPPFEEEKNVKNVTR